MNRLCRVLIGFAVASFLAQLAPRTPLAQEVIPYTTAPSTETTWMRGPYTTVTSRTGVLFPNEDYTQILDVGVSQISYTWTTYLFQYTGNSSGSFSSGFVGVWFPTVDLGVVELGSAPLRVARMSTELANYRYE